MVKANYANYTLAPGTMAVMKTTVNTLLIKPLTDVSLDPLRAPVDDRRAVVKVIFEATEAYPHTR